MNLMAWFYVICSIAATRRSARGLDSGAGRRTNPLNAKRNLEAAAKGPLPQSALQKLAAASTRAVASGKQSWPGLT